MNKFIQNEKKNKKMLTVYLLDNYFVYQFANNFSALLLYKINVFNIF